MQQQAAEGDHRSSDHPSPGLARRTPTSGRMNRWHWAGSALEYCGNAAFQTARLQPHTLGFVNPLTPKDRQDIQWYVEVYGALSLGEPDESEAPRVAAQLPKWGKALFDAVFRHRAAERLLNRFQDSQDAAKLLSISAEHPAVLDALDHDAPGRVTWEFLRPPTLDALLARLEDRNRTPVDVLHFGGRGDMEGLRASGGDR